MELVFEVQLNNNLSGSPVWGVQQHEHTLPLGARWLSIYSQAWGQCRFDFLRPGADTCLPAFWGRGIAFSFASFLHILRCPSCSAYIGMTATQSPALKF